MIKRLVDVDYTKKGQYCFESEDDKKESSKFWTVFENAMDKIKDIGLNTNDVNGGVLIN